jgi:triosephosphate isomerase (TIM)
VIIVNFKRYTEATGINAINLALICQKISAEYNLPIIPAPQGSDIEAINAKGIECWAQKFEPQLEIQLGTLINHSDFRIDERKMIQEEIYLSKTRGDKVCLCSEVLEEAIELLMFKPDFLAYEPPELIGSKTTSVALAQPDVIGKAAIECSKVGIPLLVGAGIKSAEDVRVSIKQGAVGVLVASAVVQAENQEQKLRELAEAFK